MKQRIVKPLIVSFSLLPMLAWTQDEAADVPPPPPPADESFADVAPPPPPESGTPPPSPASGPANGAGTSPVVSSEPNGTPAAADNGGPGSIKAKAKKDGTAPKVPDTPVAPATKIPPAKELVSIDFPEPTSIKDIIKAVGQWTGKNFILGAGVASSAKVQIISPQPVTKEEAYQAFLSALNVAGYTTVDTGKMVKIVLSRNANASNIKTYFGSTWAPMTDEIITQIIPLNYVDATSVASQLRTVLGSDSKIVAFQTTNSLIISDTGHKIRRVLEIIRMLDVKGNQPQVAIIPVVNLDASYVHKKIEAIFGSQSRGSGSYLQKAILEERTNALILIGPPRGLDDVVRLIKRLDKPVDDMTSQAQVHVRPLDYADAEKLAGTLQNLAQNNAGNNNNNLLNRIFSTPATSKSKNGKGSTGTAAVAELNGVKVTADKATNALIIMGSRAAFNELDNIIRLLDKRRDQVFVEADIIDVTTGNGLDLSGSVFAGGTAANNKLIIPGAWQGSRIASALYSSTDPTLAAQQTQGLLNTFGSNAVLGILGSQKINVGGLSLSPGAFLFALKNDSNSNVLQTPSLLVADNENAVFESSTQRWIESPIQDNVAKTTTLKREAIEATLKLKLKPQVSKADFVNMDLDILAENFGAIGPNGPEEKNKRQSTTKVTIQNEQTIVISGLNKNEESEKQSKVPLLGDIPILGWFFRDSSKMKQKANLMIFITPHIIRNSEDLARIYAKKSQERDEYLKAMYGDRFNENEFYQRIPGPERGKVPISRVNNDSEDQNSSGAASDGAKSEDGKVVLPSQDPNPIVAPAGSGAGGFSSSIESVSPPPPPLSSPSAGGSTTGTSGSDAVPPPVNNNEKTPEGL